ncbi:MAG: response regulator transcription factor [Rhodobiaceae bacterium]|nr:response regulator transcription factor [Rhodobiaceae bacterium]MCC0015757.1 response regulator transcription factor [Rhodobiaceae bacterium]MCC0040542.1 response regulator transcription factor [Rhodobiaceae bacterium]MCC0054015.1 response regulator transcription factor [Rhodobiaceae bacterium]
MATQDAAWARLVIADDHPLFRDALKQALRQGSGDEPAAAIGEISEAGSIEAVMEELASHPETDLVLLDLAMPGVRGLSGLMNLRARFPDIPVIVVSASDDPAVVRRCADFGASGFIPKSLQVADMRAAVAAVLAGGEWFPPDIDLAAEDENELAEIARRLSTLTPQQVRVLMMLGEGLLNKQIAYELSVSEATVKAHVSAILQKLGADSRTQAVIMVNRIDALQREPTISPDV